MSMETMLFGIGAAGNKAAIEVIEEGILPIDRVKLLNTTSKDIADVYKLNSDLVVLFGDGLGGCGKEPTKGKQSIYDAITSKTVDLGSMIDPYTKQVVLVTSTEGGTGCGATPMIAKFFEAMNLPVHVFAFIGFQDEARGINNTLKFFRELSSNVILHTILNDNFKDYTGSYSKAEDAANKEFAYQLRVLMGGDMVNSSQNIDDTDHYKIATTPGYMDIKHIDLTGMKNVEMTNKAIIDAFENGCNLDYTKGCKRLAIIINASERVQDAIDEHYEVIKRYTGEPFEIYRHIQNADDGHDYMYIVAAGLAFPEKSLIDMSHKYNSLKEKLNAGARSFDDIFAGINMDDSDEEFDMNVRKLNDPKDVDSIFNKLAGAATKNTNNAKKLKVIPTDKDGIVRYDDGVDPNSEF